MREKELDVAVLVLRAGGVVAFPTETYYGLAVDPFNPAALSLLFALKKRPARKPILTLIRDAAQLSLLTQSIPAVYEPLMKKFWPGPLTLIFKARPGLPAQLTGGTGTVGVRVSSQPLAMGLVDAFAGPITATSANISGQPPCVDEEEVQRQFGNGVDLILAGATPPGGKGSTIVSQQDGTLQLVRDGVIPFALIGKSLQGGGTGTP